MKIAYGAIGVSLTLIHQIHATVDFIALPTTGDTWIQEATATLVVGDIPNPLTGDIQLWTAIKTDWGNMLYGKTITSPQRYGATYLA
jgi:hypothetical protein